MPYRIKICCIRNRDEAAAAIHQGASLLGLIPYHLGVPEAIPEDQIAAIARGVAPGITSVLVTWLDDAATLIAQHRRCLTQAIQLLRPLTERDYHDLRLALPGIRLIQTVHVTGPEALGEARRYESYADAILLDSGNPKAGLENLGGTGRVHDWGISRAIVVGSSRPVFLAGGIRPENIAEAAHAVGPFGFDLCTGVRTHGQLDEDKLRALRAAMPAA